MESIANTPQSTIQSSLSFNLGSEQFAVPVAKVVEIIEVPEVSKIPLAPKFIHGVINVRGHVIPLIDTRSKLELSPVEFTVNTCVIVVEIEKNNQIIYAGMLVDAVQEVLEVSSDAIQDAPDMGTEGYEEFITGIYPSEGKFIMMLDLDKVFSNKEVQALQTVGHGNENHN